MSTTRASARFSTYSGAPSLQPSLAPSSNLDPNDPTSRTATTTTTTTSRAPPRSNRASVIFSSQPAPDASNAVLRATDPAKADDIQSWSGVLARMQDARFERQRYVMSADKNEEVSKLALGAKVERALSRRISTQDADVAEGLGNGRAQGGKGEKSVANGGS